MATLGCLLQRFDIYVLENPMDQCKVEATSPHVKVTFYAPPWTSLDSTQAERLCPSRSRLEPVRGYFTPSA